MTRRDYREWIRHALGQQTPVDRGVPDARPGDQPPWHPTPTNTQIDEKINEAAATCGRRISALDRGNEVLLSVDAQTAAGPYVVDMGELPGVPRRQANNVLDTFWQGTTDAIARILRGTSRAVMDRDYSSWLTRSPGLPTHAAVDQYMLYIIPAPSMSGTLRMRVARGILAVRDDDDEFQGIPSDYDYVPLTGALVLLCQSYPGDVEMQDRLKLAVPEFTNGLRELEDWSGSSASRTQVGIAPLRRRAVGRGR